jgi:hypothetical protein
LVAIAGYYAARVATTQRHATIRTRGHEPGQRQSPAYASGLLVCALLLEPAAARAEAPGETPAHRPAVVLSAGTFALVEAYDYPYRLGIQYRLTARGRWSLEPGFGAAVGPDGMAFLYLDLLRDFRLGEHWFLTPSLAAGYFTNGDAIGVNEHLEFQSAIALSRVLNGGLRVGLAVHHVSNGGLASPNNGTESLVVFVRYPLGRPSPVAGNP